MLAIGIALAALGGIFMCITIVIIYKWRKVRPDAPTPIPHRARAGCCTVLCCPASCCAVLCCAVLCCAVLCCAVLCCAVLCCALLCSAPPELCYTILQCAVPCRVVQCSAMLCCAVLCCAVLCCAGCLTPSAYTSVHMTYLSDSIPQCTVNAGQEGRQAEEAQLQADAAAVS